MSDSNTPSDKPQEASYEVLSGRRKISLQDHLGNKAYQYVRDRKKYIEKLGNAEGKEVFKYLLLLNCIECHGYVNEIQLQAHDIFQRSTRIAHAGFVLVTVSVLTALASRILLGENGLEVVYVSGISGVITTFISGIFFYLYDRSLKRMDEFHTQLRGQQKIAISLFLSGFMQKKYESDNEIKKMIDLLMSAMDMNPEINNGNAKTSTTPKAGQIMTNHT